MFLVTGASGRVGGQVVNQLLGRGLSVRAFVRRSVSAPDGAGVAVGDLFDPSSLSAALDGVEAVFLVWPTGLDDTASEVVQLLSERVRQVVYLSARGADLAGTDAEVGPILASHRHLERLLDEAPVQSTFIRGGGFAANTLGWASDIRAKATVTEPFGGIPRPLVHERDLAEVAVAALTGQTPAGQVCEITGPAILTGAEQVAAIGAAVGRQLTLQALDADAAIDRLTSQGAGEATAISMVETWKRMVAEPEQPTHDFELVTGHLATPFTVWAHDHSADFR